MVADRAVHGHGAPSRRRSRRALSSDSPTIVVGDLVVDERTPADRGGGDVIALAADECELLRS